MRGWNLSSRGPSPGQPGGGCDDDDRAHNDQTTNIFPVRQNEMIVFIVIFVACKGNVDFNTFCVICCILEKIRRPMCKPCINKHKMDRGWKDQEHTGNWDA